MGPIFSASVRENALGVLQDVAGGNNPAANVTDRASTLRITRLTPTIAGGKVFLKIETNHGITGWGEICQLETRVAAQLATSLYELLDGENPTRIEHLWQKIYRSHRDMRGGPFMTHTLAGIDMALWDIAGKVWNTPVYRLMGGPTRDKVRVYPSAKATKVGAGPQPFSGTPAQIDSMVQQVRHARRQVGADGIVMFDAHCALPPPFLMQFAAAVEPYELLYIEEPAVPGNIEVFKRLKKAINIPFAIGEQARTIWEVIPYLQEGCGDILQIDMAHTGGPTALKKIAVLGETYFAPLAPHSVTTDLGMSASLHVCFSIPMFLIHEYYPSITPQGLIRKTWTVDADGYASPPQGPGLGIEIDEQRLQEVSRIPRRPEWPTRGRLSDGSIADY